MKLLIAILANLILLIIAAKPVLANETAGGSAEIRMDLKEIKTYLNDKRVKRLAEFLQKENSPLADKAENFVKMADIYQLDWRLVPAITGVESSFGKQIPYLSYNAYGWANGTCKFSSWDESIETVSRTLAEKYLAKGLTTPEKIAPVYAPPSTTWAMKVKLFMSQIGDNETIPKLTI